MSDHVCYAVSCYICGKYQLFLLWGLGVGTTTWDIPKYNLMVGIQLESLKTCRDISSDPSVSIRLKWLDFLLWKIIVNTKKAQAMPIWPKWLDIPVSTLPPSVSGLSRKCGSLDVLQASTVCYRSIFTFYLTYQEVCYRRHSSHSRLGKQSILPSTDG
jgi:hypothetical protein